jgi:hypothetical protein
MAVRGVQRLWGPIVHQLGHAADGKLVTELYGIPQRSRRGAGAATPTARTIRPLAAAARERGLSAGVSPYVQPTLSAPRPRSRLRRAELAPSARGRCRVPARRPVGAAWIRGLGPWAPAAAPPSRRRNRGARRTPRSSDRRSPGSSRRDRDRRFRALVRSTGYRRPGRTHADQHHPAEVGATHPELSRRPGSRLLVITFDEWRRTTPPPAATSRLAPTPPRRGSAARAAAASGRCCSRPASGPQRRHGGLLLLAAQAARRRSSALATSAMRCRAALRPSAARSSTAPGPMNPWCRPGLNLSTHR